MASSRSSPCGGSADASGAYSQAMDQPSNNRTVPATARRARILEHIQTVGGASLAELARDHAVSTITVHRDLEQLSREGLVERFHGGARAVAGPRSERVETAWDRRLREAGGAKDAIAAHARRMIPDGSTIFLDASSTCFALAHQIQVEPPEEVSIVTNSPAIGLGIEDGPVRVILVPGEVDLRLRAIADGWTVDFLRGVSMDVAFMSGAALDLAHGLTTTRRQVADTLAAARASAARTVALVDATKFGRSSLVKIAAPGEFDVVVTDSAIDAATADEYRRSGVTLELAPPVPADED
jgi:DeoR/GlpR family transcriptional regulator of sugar metabolism